MNPQAQSTVRSRSAASEAEAPEAVVWVLGAIFILIGFLFTFVGYRIFDLTLGIVGFTVCAVLSYFFLDETFTEVCFLRQSRSEKRH